MATGKKSSPRSNRSGQPKSRLSISIANSNGRLSRAVARAANERPIGVFDSGIGGLTVLRALTEAMPGGDFIYLGDPAPLPYRTQYNQEIIPSPKENTPL